MFEERPPRFCQIGRACERMPSSREPAERERPGPRICFVTPTLDDTGDVVRRLEAATAGVEIAAVLARLPDADERAAVKFAKALAASVQDRGIALLLWGRPELASRSGADGAHLTGVAALQTALPSLKPQRMAGAGGLASRHDAMLAGEAGADYVMFGEPAPDGRRPAFAAVLERIGWWSEIFEIPCVGYAADAEEAAGLAAAGADFVVLEDYIWNHPGGAATALRELTERLSVGERV